MSQEQHATTPGSRTRWWAVYSGTTAIGLGRGMHAAIADSSRRTGSLEARHCRIQPVTDSEGNMIAEQLGAGGITDAESAFCSGTLTSKPTYCRPVAAMKTVLTAARRLGARVDAHLVVFQDGSRIELIPLRKDLVSSYGSSHTVRLPRENNKRVSDVAPHPRGWNR